MSVKRPVAPVDMQPWQEGAPKAKLVLFEFGGMPSER